MGKSSNDHCIDGWVPCMVWLAVILSTAWPGLQDSCSWFQVAIRMNFIILAIQQMV